MKKSTVAIVVLSVALVVSNALWFYTLVDTAVTHTYLDDSYRQARATAVQAMALLPMVARPDVSRQSIIDAAIRTSPGSRPFEKEGFFWVDRLGLRFDSNGNLAEVQSSVQPF